ncbi:UDP-N-acetylmuramoyl-L-alanine--D-glutamate ligase [Alcaligenes faecalis]|uniref:UDP-N-acetylmuramoyl-L-alanine--D-glutamate ligase n=1 Tax=Alcaligenes faecalis TaxID=511 RepID=UPI0018D116EC|nr:UDP-N-acetylmuramoyl-L-alanine--D-glutamate ligase [Alcaligenes faecalis]MBH0310087.1 UDP-N-acetylmuramoyl-L-alanine--D-glutamate ligase [Alcaligenes faecalis]
MNALSFPSIRKDGLMLILGLGETGFAAARWSLAQGAGIRVVDTRENVQGLHQLQALSSAPLDVRLGQNALQADSLSDVHTVVISPGLSPVEPALASFLAQARDRGIEVIGEIELFARALKDLADQGHESRVVAVTGTNGKTTVTAMTRHLLEQAGVSALAVGNISPAALTALCDALENNALPQVWVLELSSFQLDSTFSLQADAGVVLNISQDHLDWHGGMDAYIQSKQRMYGMCDVTLVNRDDPVVMAMTPDASQESVRSFGLDKPALLGDMGLLTDGGMQWLVANEPTDFELPATGLKKRNAPAEPAVRGKGGLKRLMPVEALQIKGRHNALNAQAALLLARCLGLGWAELLNGLRTYQGEPHRVELVRVLDGVQYLDDSKGTNVGATVAALRGFDQRVWLIAGGLGKGQDFEPLAVAAASNVAEVFLIGQDAKLIASVLDAHDVRHRFCEGLEAAVQAAAEQARSGDVVLLSPACASMDMFKSYHHRGMCFVAAVTEMALDRGEPA